MRAVAYIRVSRVGGRSGDSFISPEIQEDAISAMAQRLGLTIIATQMGGQPARSELAIELIARRLRLFAEPMRIKMLDRLRGRELTPRELAGELGTTPQNISKHLALLLEAGILARRRSGNSAYYRVIDDAAMHQWQKACDAAPR